jgi:Family of unknown function (DUF6152)
MRRQLVAWAAGTAFVVSTGVALAHHSFAMFDADQKTTLAGTVKEFQWVNPHAWIFVMVPNHEGQLDQWAVELMGPGGLSRQGWSPKTLTPGMEVKLTIHPLRDGSNGGQFVGLTLPDGTALGTP